MKIESVRATEILDSRGNPTVKAYVTLEDGSRGIASVPSGASTGLYEATELKDGDERYRGKGVSVAVQNVNTEIAEAIIGMDAEAQGSIDEAIIKLDGTDNKSRLGANAILAVSLAVSRAAAITFGLPLYRYLNEMVKAGGPDNLILSGLAETKLKMPMPLMNVMNGGAHANWVTDIQEYMIIPIGLGDFRESVRACSEVYMTLKDILKRNKYSISVGDEGGFAPNVKDNNEPFYLMAEAIEEAGYTLGQDITFGIDAAASEFYKDGKYNLKREERELSAKQLTDFYKQLIEQNGIISIEDPFSEDDWENFADITAKMRGEVQIVGDDLYATNFTRINRGIKEKATNAALIKPNQIGTLSETLIAISAAREGGQAIIISHRSGETEDAFIADLAVAIGAEEIKSGAPARGERTAKYNRLLEIEEELGE